MDGDPRPRRLGELVVHIVGLVQEQLQHQAVVRPGEGNFPHTNLHRRDQLGDTQCLQAVFSTTSGLRRELKVKQFPYFG